MLNTLAPALNIMLRRLQGVESLLLALIIVDSAEVKAFVATSESIVII